ncbi:MAG: hypothetical protein AB7F99_07230 [Vicinamibacterales bacterium]
MGLTAAILACGIAVLAVVAWATARLVAVLEGLRRDAERSRIAQLLALFTPAVATAASDARALLIWYPVAHAARVALPEEFAALDRAMGRSFPFSREQTDAAHASWTSAWLAWERSHDAEYKLKAQSLAESLGEGVTSALGRSKLEAVERERVERYQQRYEEYTRVAKALQRLGAGS